MKILGVGLGVELQCFAVGFLTKSLGLGLSKKVLFTLLVEISLFRMRYAARST
jgi:hypothetical protein